MYQCQSYYNDENELVNCTCGRCDINNQIDNWFEPDGKEHHTSELHKIVSDYVKKLRQSDRNTLIEEIVGEAEKVRGIHGGELGEAYDDGINTVIALIKGKGEGKWQ